MRCAWWLPALGCVALAGPAYGQCPDGTPPPCGRSAARAAAPSANSVAVLYFENLGRDTSDTYIADGLTEEVTARLGQVNRLAVTSRTSVRRLRNASDMRTADLGRALNAAYLVNGSVRRAGDRVRVTIELVRASTGARVWGDQYDRGTSDLLAIQEDIARAVATGITGQLFPAERATLAARPTRNPEAYDHYLRGRRAVNAFTPATIGTGVRELEDAVRLDSSFADARAELALAYALAVNWAWSVDASPSEMLRRASDASDRAMQGSPRSSESWLARGVLLMFIRPRTFDGAEDAIRRGIALDPENGAALQWLGVLQRRLGDFESARVTYERAFALDPALVICVADRGFMAYERRRFAEARVWYDSAVALDTVAWQSLSYKARVSLELGDTAGALREARLGVQRSNGQLIALTALAELEGRSGNVAVARATIDSIATRLEGMDSVSVRDGYETATALIATGEKDRALAMLERIRPVGPWLWTYLVFPDFDPVRQDPRFQRIFADSRPPNAPTIP